MFLAGHSSSFPTLGVERLLDFYSELGFDAISLGAERYGEITDPEALGRRADRCHIPIYSMELPPLELASSAPSRRRAALDTAQRLIEFAAALSCRAVVVYPREECTRKMLVSFYRFSESIMMLEKRCGALGLILVVGVRARSLIGTTALQVRALDGIRSVNVGALYDQAALTVARAEDYRTALAALRPFIRLCYCRDTRSLGARAIWCTLGRGKIPWTEILAELKRLHYSGFLTYIHTSCQRRPIEQARREVESAVAFLRTQVGSRPPAGEQPPAPQQREDRVE